MRFNWFGNQSNLFSPRNIPWLYFWLIPYIHLKCVFEWWKENFEWLCNNDLKLRCWVYITWQVPFVGEAYHGENNTLPVKAFKFIVSEYRPIWFLDYLPIIFSNINHISFPRDFIFWHITRGIASYRREDILSNCLDDCRSFIKILVIYRNLADISYRWG